MNALDVTSILNGRRFPAPNGVIPPEDPYDLMGEFIESTSGQLEELEKSALAFEQCPTNEDYAAAIRRVLHKMKGESGMAGFSDLERLFHEAENAFEAFPIAQRTDMLLRVKDWVLAVFDHLKP